MYGSVIFIIGLLVFPFLFPEAFIQASRKIRRWLRDDIRRRVTKRQWEAIQDEFDDL